MNLSWQECMRKVKTKDMVPEPILETSSSKKKFTLRKLHFRLFIGDLHECLYFCIHFEYIDN